MLYKRVEEVEAMGIELDDRETRAR